MQTAVQTQQSNLGYPFKLGTGLAGQFPNYDAIIPREATPYWRGRSRYVTDS